MSFLYELSPTQFILLVIGAIVGHLALFLASRRVNVLYVLASVVLVLGPFSGAAELGAEGAGGMFVKWIRGYALVLLLLLGLFKYRRGTLGAASQIWLAFTAVFVLSAVWSDSLLPALGFKVQFGFVVLAGLLLASTVRDQEELIRGLRVLSVAGGLMGFFMFMYFLTHAQSSLQFGRLVVFGANANRIAINLGAMLLVCIYLALNERSAFWKAVAFCCCGTLVTVMTLTGCRGSMAAVVFGFLIQVFPQSGRRIRVMMLPVFLACVAVIALNVVEGEADVARFVSTKDTRSEIWGKAVQLFKEKPLIGRGFVFSPGGSQRWGMHSIYLQVAVEMGVLGFAGFGVCLALLAQRGLQSYRSVRRQRILTNLGILPLSLVAASLFYGLVTTMPLNPSPFAMLMAMGIGLMDRFPRFAILERRRTLRRMAYEYARRRLLKIGGLGSPEGAR
ncbi:MAG: hypothetical protein A2V70_11575 [Planctomycetes bacterium RBG_13_63_9]|nr:MAG: hypothetical protein A2V70_11575 [Planctomycetes bacterium RBG_13_63_9]